MNGRSNNQRQRKNQESFQKIIVRCNALQRPVYEHEVCSKYMIKTEATAQKICKNCKYSF